MKTEKNNFIKNIVDFDNDAMQGLITFTVCSLFDVEYKDEQGSYWKTETNEIEIIKISWKEYADIDNRERIKAYIKETYNVEM